ncbi:MAG: M23 family metallopeptidase [Elusimicrobiota bacterium]
MKIFRRLSRYLGRHVTVLVIPHSDLPLVRGRFSMAFLIFSVALWTGLTIWAGFLSGRHVDYWITKADNMVIRTKMNYMGEEMARSREVLNIARATDKQLRILLGMRQREEVLESDVGLGGPSVADRAGLGRLLSPGARLSQTDIRRTAEQLRSESQRRLASFQEIAWYITNQRSLIRSTPRVWPAAGNITSGFGYRFSPYRQQVHPHLGHFHEGVDIANTPDTLIVATADGVVRYAGWSSGFGMMVLIDHGFGYSTLYGHTSKVTVRVGDHVVRGRRIAYMGTTGRSTGNHLHYEVWRHSRPVNPMKYLQGRPGRSPESG